VKLLPPEKDFYFIIMDGSGSGGALLTCITCGVGFHEGDLQRAHYKTDWHRYNLKRKVVQLPPVTEGEFRRRVQQQQASEAIPDASNVSYCTTCKKAFGNDKAYQNHLFSKKHMQMDPSNKSADEIDEDNAAMKQPGEEPLNSQEAILLAESIKGTTIKDAPPKKPAVKKSIFEDDDEDEDDDWEDIEGVPLQTNQCLFCEMESEDMEANLDHMCKEHSFFIPDMEYCVDIEGLVEYLGEKVGEGMVCLWCNDRSKSYYSVPAVQQHMRDKGHCKILHEGDSIFEFADFYDYSTSYPDGADVSADEPYVPEQIHFNDNMQLVLPSGITLGHRALKVYYKQYIRPSNQLVANPSRKGRNLLSKYKAIGYGTTSLVEAQRKHKDQQVFKRVRDKYQLRLGMNGNKTKQMHYRAQVLI
jgi:pre-60S factor REI1